MEADTEMKNNNNTEISDTCTGCGYEAPSIPLLGGSYGAYCDFCRASSFKTVDGTPCINVMYFNFTDQSCTIEDFLEADRTKEEIFAFLRITEKDICCECQDAPSTENSQEHDDPHCNDCAPGPEYKDDYDGLDEDAEYDLK